MFGRFLLYPLATSRSTLSCAGNHRLAQWFLHYSLFMLKTISVTCLTQIVGGMRGIPWILVLLALVIFANVRGVPASAAWGEAYGGVFVGAGFQENRIVDPRGFVDGSYLGFGRSTHYFNRSGNNPCGPGGPEEACPYKVENDLAILRLAIIRRFDF